MQQTNWYVLYTAPRAEKKVNTRLSEKGITTYLPLIKSLKQWSDRKKWVEEPAFNSYIFINGNEEILELSLTTPGVLKVISFGNTPQTIPNNQIEWLKLLLNSPELIEIKDHLQKGDNVEVISGPFMGIKGKVISSKSDKKFAVNIEIMNRAICVKVAPQLLKKIPANT